jgi:hypothetical protein
MGTGTFPEVNWWQCEDNHPPLPSTEVQTAWSYTTTPPYTLIVRCLIKHRNNFIFCLNHNENELYLHHKDEPVNVA